MIHSDWHIHTDASYDAKLPIETLIQRAQEQGLRRFGVTDHANFNDEKFLGDLRRSAQSVQTHQAQYPSMVSGVELTPIEKPLFDYITKTGTREGYVPVIQDTPYGIELAATKEYLMSLGVRYAIGAAHWRVDVPDRNNADNSLSVVIREWFRQQMYLACDERVTILGHPWWHGTGLWYEDFSAIPQSMNEELAAALLENHKYAEMNAHFLISRKTSDKFRYQYAEFMRFLFEKGIPITYGSDCHGGEDQDYPDMRPRLEKYLSAAGFRDGDFSEIAEEDLW